MTLRERLAADLKDALRARDEVRLRSIRALNAALQSAEIARRVDGTATLSDDEVLAVVQKQAKQRRESIAQFETAGRADLVATEQEELAVLEAYLPQQLSDEQIQAVVAEIVRDAGAAGPQAMGKVMGAAMARLRGQADGSRVQAAVKAALAA
ncbi:MAG: GatB/YqeY domain-containing protein [Rhodothermales bacterium]|nr:GatB/YqeY domain-containing protein [Rhodothermales bacterium]